MTKKTNDIEYSDLGLLILDEVTFATLLMLHFLIRAVFTRLSRSEIVVRSVVLPTLFLCQPTTQIRKGLVLKGDLQHSKPKCIGTRCSTSLLEA